MAISVAYEARKGGSDETIQNIAEALGKTEDAVRKALTRIRKKTQSRKK
jgi:hypothetical protein